MDLTLLISSGLVGSGLTLAYNYFTNKGTSKTNEYIKTINMLRFDIGETRKQLKEYSEKIDVLENRLHEKDKIVTLLEATAWESPFPYWLKGLNGEYLYVNKAYEVKFHSLGNILGKTDIEVWGNEGGAVYHENDRLLINSKEEYIILDNELKGHLVYKWKRRAGNIVIGIAGISVPINQ